jgi:hypothetical protein
MSYSPQTRRGTTLAAVHLVAFRATVFYIHTSSDSQAGAIWLLWGWIDIPWSVLYFIAGPEYSNWLASISARSVVLANLLYLPHVIHGFIGTVWWFFLPGLFSRLAGLMKRKAPST